VKSSKAVAGISDGAVEIVPEKLVSSLRAPVGRPPWGVMRLSGARDAIVRGRGKEREISKPRPNFYRE
jgi:hypothetical protein